MGKQEWDEGSEDDQAQAYIDAKKRQGVTVSGGSSEVLFRKALEAKVGETLTTAEMQEKYTVLGFSGGYCAVMRISDGKRGSLDFTHYPRFYHSFREG